MDKLIEMTADGRLTIVWVALGFLVIAAVWELWPWVVAHRRERSRRVYLSQKYGKSAKYLR
jgi:hypothetical protein